MLKDANVMATVAVKDLAAARAFYVDKLGLGLDPDAASEPGVLSLRSGDATLLVYESQYAGTNRATAATWSVGDELEAVVQTLKARGVPFEHYDMPDTTLQGDIHVSGAIKVAWCKDPDGNILSLVNG
jgi:catechol 2,3-dioxygenase-like lactoylglutathione lyase family enzyme